MTLHLSFVNESYILQLGDRLLTAGGCPWDPAANKTIVVEATKGRAVIGYAGLAHVDGEPTGEWLLRLITASSEAQRMFTFGSASGVHLGELKRRLVDGIERAFSGRRSKLEVLVSGWGIPRRVRDSKRPTAFVYTIRHSGVRGARCRISQTRRLRFREPSSSWCLTGVGRGDLVDLTSVFERIRTLGDPTSTADQVEQELVETMRSIGAIKGSGVGLDVMSVLLTPFPLRDEPHIRYFRDTSVEDGRIGYLPALVTPRMVSPAAVMNTSSGGSFVFNADTPHEWRYSTETRPPWTGEGPYYFTTHPNKPYYG